MPLEVSIDIADTRHQCTGQKFYPVYIKRLLAVRVSNKPGKPTPAYCNDDLHDLQ
jgi:hypothetical protein